MRFNEAKNAILSTYQQLGAVEAPVTYLESDPGTGKTTIGQSIAEDLGIKPERTYIFRPSLHDPVDLTGAPKVTTVTKFMPPAWIKELSTNEPALVLWDELPQGQPLMQCAIAGALLDRQISDVYFGENVYQIATGNPTSSKAGANRVLSQVDNRLVHITLDPHIDDWMDWALNKKLCISYVAWLKTRPEMLMKFDANARANPTPRSHEMACKIPSEHLSHNIYFELLKGTIGEAAAVDYLAFKGLTEELPTYADIIKAPTKAKVPSNSSHKYAVMAMLVAGMKEEDIGQGFKYLDRFPKEYHVFYIRGLLRFPSLANHPEFDKRLNDYASLLN